MKLLLFSDLHTDTRAAQSLVERSQLVDVVVGAGDFGNQRRNIGRCIDVLRAINRPTVLVAGNNESTEELRQACLNWPNAYILHGSGVTIEGIPFFGIGGGIPPTPFGEWSYDFTEAEAEKLLQPCPSGGVRISHSPPQGAADIASNGQHLGSIAVRDTIMRQQPVLVVCGHIHASAGQRAMIGASTIINAGPAGVEFTLSSQ